LYKLKLTQTCKYIFVKKRIRQTPATEHDYRKSSNNKPGIQLKPSGTPYDDTIADVIASAISE